MISARNKLPGHLSIHANLSSIHSSDQMKAMNHDQSLLQAWSLILIFGCAFGSVSLATKISVNQLCLYNYIYFLNML